METYHPSDINRYVQRNLELFKEIRLSGMSERWRQVYQTQSWIELPPEVQMYDLLSREAEKRHEAALKRLIRNSNLPSPLLAADFKELRTDSNRCLDKQLLTLLSSGGWMTRDKPADLVIVGATGVGKSYFAACCLRQAMSLKKKCYFIRASRLFTELRVSHLKGTLEERKKELAGYSVLVLDDFLLEDMSEMDLSDLLHIIEDRSQSKSTIFTSQYPLDTWIQRMKVSALAEAIVDRLRHSAYQLVMKGPSQREKIK